MSILGVEPALYSILTYVAAARTLDFVIYGIEEYTAITIISSQSAAIRERIIGELGRGVTVYKGYGGLSGAEQEILYCVVTRLEIGKVKAIVRAVDEHAFIVSHPLADAEGGVVKRARTALAGPHRTLNRFEIDVTQPAGSAANLRPIACARASCAFE